MPRRSGTADMERFLERTAAVWGLVWVFALAVTLASDPAIVQHPALASAVLAVQACVFFGVFATGLPTTPWVLGVSLAAPMVNALNINASDNPSAQLLITTWLNLATLVTAFLTEVPRSGRYRVVMTSAVCGGLLELNVVSHGMGALNKTLVALPVGYATAVGLAVVEGVAAARSAANQANTHAALAADSAAAAATIRAQWHESRFVAGLLHDTVINTLGAIRRGISHDVLAITRERCRAHVADIEAALFPPADDQEFNLAKLCDVIAFDARLLQVEVTIEVSADIEANVPKQIWTTARVAVRELLTNISKHSGSKVATVVLSFSDSSLLNISVADCGRGMRSIEALSPVGGLRKSVIEPCEAVGGMVSVHSMSGLGTAISIDIPLRPEQSALQSTPSQPTPAHNSFATIAVKSSRWLLLLSLLEAALFVGQHDVLLGMAAVILLVISVGFIWLRGDHGFGAAMTVATAVVISAVISLPMLAAGTCRADVPYAWGVDGAAVLVVILCFLGPLRLAAPVATVASFTGLLIPYLNGQPVSQCIAGSIAVLPIEIGVVLVVTAFRIQLERLWRQAGESHAQNIRASTRNAEIAAAVQVRTQRLRPLLTTVAPLMVSIADGTLDPRDPDVQVSAGRAETALRSILLLDERLGNLGHVLAKAVLTAYSSGASARVVSGEYVPDPQAAALGELERVLELHTRSMPSQSTLSLGLFERDDSGLLTVVTTGPIDQSSLATVAASGLIAVTNETDDESLMEFTWKTS